MEQVKLIIGGKVWQMSRKQAYATLSIIIDGIRRNKKYKYMLVAVERNKAIALVRDSFETKQELDKEIASYEKLGFNCFSTESKVE